MDMKFGFGFQKSDASGKWKFRFSGKQLVAVIVVILLSFASYAAFVNVYGKVILNRSPYRGVIKEIGRHWVDRLSGDSDDYYVTIETEDGAVIKRFIPMHVIVSYGIRVGDCVVKGKGLMNHPRVAEKEAP